jgi:hypothetical protein
MKIGDLVRVKHTDSDIRNRNAGIILKFDACFFGSTRGDKIRITQVLWDDKPAWIDSGRIELIKNV